MSLISRALGGVAQNIVGLGGVAQNIVGLGGVFTQTAQAAKQTALSAQDLSDALAMWGVPRYRGKRKSLFKCDANVWGYWQDMKTRHITIDGLYKEDFVSPPFTGTTSSTSSTSTTSTI